MVDEERGGNGNGNGALTEETKPESMNRFEIQIVNGDANSRDGLQMYKRRKHMKGSAESNVLEDGKAITDSGSQVSNKTTKEPVDKIFDNSSCDQVSLPRLDSNSFVNGSGGCLLRHSRELVLEGMYQSLSDSEGGLRECIRNALMSHPDSGCSSTIKDRHCFGEERQRLPLGHVGVLSNGLLNESNHHTNTELCKHVFFNILISEKFTELCNLLFRSFHGVKVDRVLDVSLINSRMKEGAYESSPMLFHSDIQQVWTRLQKVGNEMVALGKSLSDNARTYCEKVGASVCSTCEDGKDEHLAQESDMHANPERTEACGTYRVCTCRRCGEMADGGNCLVCDSCEEMYHVSCIEPAVEEVPLINWYCANCVAKGMELPHENCVLCERLKASRLPADEVDGILVSEDELEEDGSQRLSKGGQRWARCNICKNEVKTSEKYRTCGHLHCPSKYYHDNCLTSKQLGIYASCWYCPSCLCRSCLTDKDDDKIVMCDGCDQAYHIYCMQPPCESIPRGNWFCRKCDAGIQRIRKAKKAYESMQNKLKSKDGKGKGKGGNGNLKNEVTREAALDKSGGVDMLLTAAKTLNYEENMAELRKKRKN